MSEFTLVKYLHNEATENVQLQQQMHKVAQLIEENERLKEADSVAWESKCRCRMEIYTLETIHEQRRSEQLAQRDALTVVLNAYSTHLALSEQLKRIDLQKIMGYDLQNQQQQWQEDLQEMDRDYERQRKLHEQMESRNIVQQLRQQQKEHAVAKMDLEKAGNNMAASSKQIIRKLETIKMQRNELIVNLIKGSKELQKMREELQRRNETGILLHKKVEIKQKIQQLQKTSTFLDTQSHLEKSNTIAATGFNAFEPLNFFKTFKFEPLQLPTFLSFFNTLPIRQELELSQIYKQEQDESNTSLRSILRKEKTDTEQNIIWPTTPKHVHFDTPGSSDSSRGSITPSPRTTATTNDTQKDSPTNCGGLKMSPEMNEHETMLLSGQIEQTMAEPMPSAECISLSDVEMQTVVAENQPKSEHVQMTTVETVNAGTNKAENNKIDIQESRIVKPAGTPLPKTISIALNLLDTPTTTPTNPKQTQNTYAFFDEMLKCSAAAEISSPSDMEEGDTSDEGQQEGKKQQTIQSTNAVPNASKITTRNTFESFLLMNVDNRDTEDIDENMPQFSDAEVLNFNSDLIDCRNVDNGDERFSFDLSDGELQNVPNTNNFL